MALSPRFEACLDAAWRDLFASTVPCAPLSPAIVLALAVCGGRQRGEEGANHSDS